MYRPLRAFLWLASLLFMAGTAVGARFVYYYLTGSGQTGHIQSLVLAAILLIVSFVVLLGGLLADLVGANRKLLEDIIIRLRRLEYQAGVGVGQGGQREPRSEPES
jgi:hypothetical protein